MRFIIILHLFFLITVSCGRKSISPPANKLVKEKSRENKAKTSNQVGNRNSSGKAGNLFASEVKEKNENTSGGLFSSGYKEKKNFGVKGKEGKKAFRKKRKWKLFKKKTPEEKSMEAENTRLFKKTNNSNEQKNRQKKNRFRQEGLFQRGVMPN